MRLTIARHVHVGRDGATATTTTTTHADTLLHDMFWVRCERMAHEGVTHFMNTCQAQHMCLTDDALLFYEQHRFKQKQILTFVNYFIFIKFKMKNSL